MSDLLTAGLVLALLCLASAAGRALLRILPAHHRSPDTFAFTQTVSSLLVTFTALVLGLLITSVNADFKKTDTDVRGFATTLIRLDAELAGLGPPLQPAHVLLRQYTAAVIASTWPEEPPPSGPYPVAIAHGSEFDAPNLGDLLAQAEQALQRFAAVTGEQTRLQASCLARLDALRDQRWILIGEAHSTISRPFFAMMLFWLLVVFVTFGLGAPGNATAAVFILLVALSVAGAVFVILELDGPLDGLIKVPSESMRHALAHLDGAA